MKRGHRSHAPHHNCRANIPSHGKTVHDPYVLHDPRHTPGLLVLLMILAAVALIMFTMPFMTLTVVAFTMFLVMLTVMTFATFTMLLVMLTVMTFAMFLVMLAMVALVVFPGLPRERMAQTIKHTHRYPPWQFGLTHTGIRRYVRVATPSTPPVPAHKQITRVSANAYWEYTLCIIPCWGDNGWTARSARDGHGGAMIDGRGRGAMGGSSCHGGSASAFETFVRAIAASGGRVRRRMQGAWMRAIMAKRWGPPEALALLATVLVVFVMLSQPLPCAATTSRAASTPTAAASHVAPWAGSAHLSTLHLSHPPCTRARPWLRPVTRDRRTAAASSPAPGPVPARRHAIPFMPLADTRAMRAALTGPVGRPLSAAARRAVLQIFLL